MPPHTSDKEGDVEFFDFVVWNEFRSLNHAMFSQFFAVVFDGCEAEWSAVPIWEIASMRLSNVFLPQCVLGEVDEELLCLFPKFVECGDCIIN